MTHSYFIPLRPPAGGPVRRPYDAPETCPLIRCDLRSCHLHLGGKAYGRLRCAAPMRQTNRPHAEAVPLIRRASRDTFPQGKAYGPPQGSPLRRKPDHERWFGKPRRRCGTAPAAIFANPGPSGPEGIAEATPFLRAGNPATSNNRASPVMGSGVRRIWARSAHPEPSPGALWFLCRHGQRNSPPAGGEILCENHQEAARPGGRALRKSQKSPGRRGQTPPYRGAKRRERQQNPPVIEMRKTTCPRKKKKPT